jgi:phosphatidate phosphatase APP1
VTMTTAATGILQSTFADIPKTTSGMPEFYKVLDESLGKPAWFYLSASPYNLYPFLHEFVGEHYPSGTMILRDASWMSFAGILQSLTQGVKDYKTDRIAKIHSWLPRRRFICIGDSTQSDPESYAEMYAKYPDWIKAIYIRKVTDAPNMENKNKAQRFRDAFKDVPDSVWRVFVDPKELADHVKHVAGSAHPGILGTMLSL